MIGINADVRVLVSGFFDGFAESGVDFRDARPQKILKADQQREFDSLLPQILNDLEEVDADGIAKNRANLQMAFGVDTEVRFAPKLDAIQLFGVLNSPGFFFSHLLVFAGPHEYSVLTLRKRQSLTETPSLSNDGVMKL